MRQCCRPALFPQAEGTPVPLPAGGFTAHHGKTLHYTRGNKSDHPRRAVIVVFRPQAMIEFERKEGCDYGLSTVSAFLSIKRNFVHHKATCNIPSSLIREAAATEHIIYFQS